MMVSNVLSFSEYTINQGFYKIPIPGADSSTCGSDISSIVVGSITENPRSKVTGEYSSLNECRFCHKVQYAMVCNNLCFQALMY